MLRRRVGADQALAAAEIARILRIDERNLRRLISVLVHECDVPVCSSMHEGRHGYYLPATLCEARAMPDAIRPVVLRHLDLIERLAHGSNRGGGTADAPRRPGTAKGAPSDAAGPISALPAASAVSAVSAEGWPPGPGGRVPEVDR